MQQQQLASEGATGTEQQPIVNNPTPAAIAHVHSLLGSDDPADVFRGVQRMREEGITLDTLEMSKSRFMGVQQSARSKIAKTQSN